MKAVTLFLAFWLLFSNAQSAKILGIFPMTARSHYILGSSLMRALAEKGHDVTVISPFYEKTPPKNGSYRDIVLTGMAEEHDKKMQELGIFTKKKINMLLMVPFMGKMMISMTEQVLNHTNVQKLIKSDETFDLVIVEEFMNHAHKAFAPYFKGHLVLFSTMGASNWINGLVGNPTPLSYVPDPILGYSSKMTFGERLYNSVFYLTRECLNHVFVNPKHDALIKNYFSKDLHLKDIMYNASIILVNSHSSTNQPVPLVPSMVEIGGFHISPPQELPEDLQEMLDNAKDGVIYFSLGSSAKSTLLPPEKRQIFINTFAKLKELVIWKWESDELPGKPKNVVTRKWLPQQDILAHPNVKLFITHGGLLSTTETIYHGMPVLAIPLGGDQHLNAQKIVSQGFGRSVKFHDMTEELLTENLEELLSNPKYRQNAKTRSQVFHDRLVSPMDTAVYWIEYIIRHGGTPHLRVASLDLPWYKYFLLDVIAFITLTTLIVLYLCYKITKMLLKTCRKKDKVKIN